VTIAEKSIVPTVHIDDARRGVGSTFLGSGLNTIETVGHLALANAGVRIADTQPAVEQARAMKTSDELTPVRANRRVRDAAIMRLRATLRPGISENEV
jgi:Xaa-Pro aminopeptidase